MSIKVFSHILLGIMVLLLLFVILHAMVMKVDWLIVLYPTVLIAIIGTAMMMQSPLLAVRSNLI